MENFKDIIGYENYQVSNLGRVKSLNYKNTWKEKIMKLQIDKAGYYNIILCKNGKVKRFRVNRLVGQAFLGLDINDKKMFVCHKDDNPLNNHKDNLFLGTHQDNMKDCKNKGRQGRPMKGKFGKNNPSSKKIIQYSKDGNFIKTWDSMMDIERKLGISQGNISLCCSGKLKTTGGFKWLLDCNGSF